MQEITLRNASKEDAQFIADCVLAAIGAYDFKERPEEYESILAVCKIEGTLYSYRNAIIACDSNANPIGCLVAYAGDNYKEMREYTFSIVQGIKGSIPIGNSAMETGPEEYYLDSMAIIPQWRGKGLGMILFDAHLERAVSLGYKTAALLVEKSHPKLQSYYENAGFKPFSELTYFEKRFVKMKKSL